MLSNLVKEMKRTGADISDIALCIDCSEQEVRNKVKGTAYFTYFETVKIRRKFFPQIESEYLFMDDEVRL